MIHGIDTGLLVAAEVADHANHQAARSLLARLFINGDRLAIAPQVLAEFMHVVTDPRRFDHPLDMQAAHLVAQRWWMAREIVQVFPDPDATDLFFRWRGEHRLGRKRLLDTLLAATYRSVGITSILTTNPGDFGVLGGFTCLTPRAGVPQD